MIESFEVLAEGADVVVEYRALGLGIMVFGQDHLLLGISAADGGAVAVAARGHPSGADALDPRDLVGMLLVGRAPDLALIGTGGAQYPFKVEAGYDVLHLPVAIIAPQFGVERLKARGQDDRPYLYLHPLRLLMEIYRLVLADPSADGAFLALEEEAAVGIYVGDQRDRLRKVVYGLALFRDRF